MSSLRLVFNSVNRNFARQKTSNSINPLEHCPLTSSDSTSRLGASSSIAVVSSLPLLSEAAAVDYHNQDQDFSDPSQHLHDVSLEHHHPQHQDFFDSQDQHQEFFSIRILSAMTTT